MSLENPLQPPAGHSGDGQPRSKMLEFRWQQAVTKSFRTANIALVVMMLCSCYDHQATDLGTAASLGDMARVKQLVANGANVNGCVGYEGCDTPLGFAASSGRLEVVTFLVAHGAAINTGAINAVFWAAFYGKADVVDYLLSKDGRLICDKVQLAALKRNMTTRGRAQLYAKVEKTWVAP